MEKFPIFPLSAFVAKFFSDMLQELPAGWKERLNRARSAALFAGREKHPECSGMPNAERLMP
jgi:hypothetical protein